jgi:PAS domain S-box-containing protein
MKKKMTESGIEVIGGIPWGTHFCQFYQTKEDLIDILVPYFKAGLENNEFCLWIISQPLKVEEATGALRVAVPDIDTYLAKGQLEIKPISLYTKNNTFDSPSVSNNLIETNNHALASGYDGLRLSMNTLWLEKAGHDYLIDSDEKVNNIIDKNSMTVLYTYYLDKCNAIGIIDTFASHQFVLAKKEGRWERINNFGKIKAEETEIKLKEANDNLKILREKTIQCEKAYTLLEKNEKSLAHAQKMTHVGSWGLDIKTDESKWSNEMYHIFGLDPQEFGPSDNTFLQYVHPEDREYVNNAIKEALEGKPYSIDYRIILSNGDEGVIHEQREITFDIENIPIRVVGTIQDIAGRKKIEKALKLAIDYNRGLIDSSLDPMFVTDTESKLTDANKAVETATGYLREELIGTYFTNYFTDYEQAKENYGEVLKEGRVLNRELEIKHKDGHITPVLYNSSARLNEKGEIIGAFATASDITERKKAEQALRETQSHLEKQIKERTRELKEAYDSLLESEIRLNEAQKMAHIGNWDWDVVTDKVYWSDETYSILKLDPLKFGATYDAFLSYVHPDDLNNVKDAFKRALNGKPFSIDYRIILAGGEERIVRTHAEVIFDDENSPVRMRGTVQDITKHKKAEETLAKIETARKKEIHHRIKNNLQVISSLLDLQAEKFKNIGHIKDLEVQEAFKESQDRVRSMFLIHEELYKGGGIDALDISSYIKELTKNLLLAYSLGNNNISLDLDLEANIFFDMDTATPMGIIINELVSNSLKHAFSGRDKGEIRVKLHKNEKRKSINNTNGSKNRNCKSANSFTLTVSDNGVGIPENLNLKNLNSLGLQLINVLVEQLDGELELKRNNGTEFTIRFKVIEKNGQVSTPT